MANTRSTKDESVQNLTSKEINNMKFSKGKKFDFLKSQAIGINNVKNAQYHESKHIINVNQNL